MAFFVTGMANGADSGATRSLVALYRPLAGRGEEGGDGSALRDGADGAVR